MSGILRLESLTKGNTLKQGDKTPLKYRLFDADGEKLNIAGKSAVVRLMYPDFLRIGYESEPLTVSSDNTVTFSIDKIIQPVLYYLEITVDGKYIFPSRNDESKLNIDKSSQGSDATIIEIIGKDVLVRDIKNMVDSEIEPVVNDMIVSNQKVIENEKIVKDVQILSEQLEARQNQVEQFNNQVITEMTDKDVISAPELIESRTDIYGEEHDLISDRLNKSERNLKQLFVNVKQVTEAQSDWAGAINSLIAEVSLSGGGEVALPTGTYDIYSPIIMRSNVTLRGYGRVIIRSHIDTAGRSAVQIYGSRSNPAIQLTENAMEGDLTLSLSSTSSVVEGDYIYISQNIPADLEHRLMYTSQLLIVDKIDGSNVTLSEPLTHSYMVENSATVSVTEVVSNATVDNIEIDHLGTLNNVMSIDLKNTYGAIITRIKSINSGGMGVGIGHSRNFMIDGVKVSKRTDTGPGKGYAVMCFNSSYGVINRVDGYNVRHTIDFAQGTHNVNVSNSIAYQNTTGAFSSHGQNCKHIKYSNCHVKGSDLYGFVVGNTSFKYDSNYTYVNCTASDCVSDGFSVEAGSHSIQFIGCSAERTTNGFRVKNSKDVKFTSIDVKDVGSRGISIDTSEDIMITGARVENANEGLSLVVSENVLVSNLTLVGNYSVRALLILTSKNVAFSNLRVNATNTSIVGGELIYVYQNSEDILFSGLHLNGYAKTYGVLLDVGVKRVSFVGGSIKLDADTHMMRINQAYTRDIRFSDMTITTVNPTAGKKAIEFNNAKYITFHNCIIDGDITAYGADNFYMTNNPSLNGTYDIRGVTKGNISNNMGELAIISFPAHDGINIIRENNIVL